MPNVRGSYRGIAEIITRYWVIYGGHAAVMRSPFFHLSFVLLLFTMDTWKSSSWWNDVISIVPNLLGFTLGGFAIFLGFGDEKFKGEIAGKDSAEDDKDSPYLSVSSTFLHFVFVQIVALLWALVAKGLHFSFSNPEIRAVADSLKLLWLLGDILGYWLFLYGICLGAAAGIAIFRVATWYDRFQIIKREKRDGNEVE